MRPLATLLLAALLTHVVACGGADEAAPQSDEAAVEAAGGAERIYKLKDADSEGDFLFRIRREGDALSGKFLMLTDPAGAPGIPPGTVTGSVEADGTHKMTWQMADFGKGEARPITFTGKLVRGNLVGTMTGDDGAPKPTTLSAVRRGATHNNKPLGVSYAIREKVGACEAQITSVEVFALKNEALEKDLNEQFASARARARGLCSGGADAASGGTFFGVLNTDIVSFSSSGMTYLPNQDFKRETFERVNLELETGKPLELFGDVFRPDTAAALGVEIQKVIDAMPINMINTEAARAELKSVMADVVAQGKLAESYLLGSRGVTFGVGSFNHPKVGAVLVKYEDARPLLAPNGKARSAWSAQ